MASTSRESGGSVDEVEPFRDWLAARGYSPPSVVREVRHLSQLGVWMAGRGRPGSAIDVGSVYAVFAEHRRQSRRRMPVGRGAGVLVTFLRERGLLVEPATESSPPVEDLLALFRPWLVDERNLAGGMVGRYERTACRFLTVQALH